MRLNERRKVTVPQLARQWGVSPNKVLGFVRNGELRAVNLASQGSTRPRYAIDIDDIAEFERKRQVVVDQRTEPVKRRRTAVSIRKFF